MIKKVTINAVRQQYELLRPLMNERLRRLWAASEALSLPRGGVNLVAQATGLSRMTLWAGKRELQQHPAPTGAELPPHRSRCSGAGRPLKEVQDSTLIADLQKLLESNTRGDPQSPLQWTSKSTRHLAAELHRQGHSVGYRTVAALLHDLGYSLQANRKTREGEQHPDRDAQFEYINRRVHAFQKQGQPVISVDSKKKELIGDFRNPGWEWHRRGEGPQVNTHDFPDEELGKVTPGGVYDLTSNQGWVSVGLTHNTAEFATETIRRWWREMGVPLYRHARKLLVIVDAGGSNSYRSRLWKVCVQRLANELDLKVTVCHFPPGTSKWNTIEHRLFSEITKNWRGKPLESRAIVVNLIGATKTQSGLQVRAALDSNLYEEGIEVSDDALAAVNMKKEIFHGEWNYTISPQ